MKNITTNGATSVAVTRMTNDQTIPLRVPSALKDALILEAVKEDRSLSSYIKRVLEAHLASLAPAKDAEATFTMKAKPKAKAKAKGKK